MPEGLKSKIPEHKKLIADQGYRNEPQISIQNNFDDSEFKKFKARARSRQESINTRIKSFKILSERFRHDVNLQHKHVFHAVCVIVQYDLDCGGISLFPNIAT
jgi:DDE superfamily endonuclease